MRRLKNYLKIRPAAWLTLCLLFTALAAWAFVIEPRSLVVREHQLSLPSWPSTLHGLRVAVLADLHTGSPFNGLDKLERIVQETNQAQPDLILIPGDIVVTGVVGGRFVPPESIASTLRKLRAPVGVYAVLGNHDRGLDTERIRRALNQAGIPTLEDHAMLVSFRQKRLWLAGVSDFWTAGHKVKHTLTQVTTSDPVILFTHNPDIFPEIPNRVMLTIAGHTHGGQVALPLVGRPIVPSEFGQRYAIGHILEGNRHLFVSPGLGTSILPVRFGVPPEVSLLTIHSADRKRSQDISEVEPHGLPGMAPLESSKAGSMSSLPTLPKQTFELRRPGAKASARRL